MPNIGFEVAPYVSKPFSAYTNEELLEYWYKLRLTCKTGKIDTSDFSRKGLSSELYVADLQNEIIRRMSKGGV